MDDEILKTVESMLGKNVTIVDCEKRSTTREEEILLINGIPITIDGADSIAIKNALITGEVPSCELLNQLLFRAGILRQPVHLETSLSVKSTLITKEEVTVARGGCILDEKSTETKEDTFYESACKELWEPIKIMPADNCPQIECTQQTVCSVPNVDHEQKHCQQKQFDIPKKALQSIETIPTEHQTSSNTNAGGCEIGSETLSIYSSSNNSSSSKINGPLSGSSSTISSLSSSRPILFPSSNSHNRCFNNDFVLFDKGDQHKKCASTNIMITGTGANDQEINENGPVNSQQSIEIVDNKMISYQNQPISSCSDGSGTGNGCINDSGHDDLFSNSSSCTQLASFRGHTDTGTPTTNSLSSAYALSTSLSTDDPDFCRKIISGDTDSLVTQSLGTAAAAAATTTMTMLVKCKPQQHYDQQQHQQHFDQHQHISSSAASINSVSSIHQSNIPPSVLITKKKNNSNTCNNKISADAPLLTTQIANAGDQAQHNADGINKYGDRRQFDTDDIDDNILVYRDSSLISGSLEALIQHMVPTSTYYPDRSYIFAFLLSARLFIRPYELLQRICHISNEQQQQQLQQQLHQDQQHQSQQHLNKITHKIDNNDEKNTEITSTCCIHRLIQVLAEWMATFPYDFRDERIMIYVRQLTKKFIQIDRKLETSIDNILKTLSQTLDELNQYEQFLEHLNFNKLLQPTDSDHSQHQHQHQHQHHHYNVNTQQQHIRHNSHTSDTAINSIANSNVQQSSFGINQQQNNLPYPLTSDLIDICANSTQLAHQLTHIELKRLSHIGPEEFVQAFVKDNPHIDPLLSDTKKTRNLESYVQWFNRLSYLVASEIVKHSKKKQRIRIIEYWIETARECFNIGNFNSLMAIIAGLNMSPISRLKKTWSKVQSAKFSVLEHQMDPSSNFNSYRSTLKAAMWRSAGATDERERIVIPFFSLLVKDLYFLNEGCSNRLPNGYINFEKFWQLAKQVNEFIAWKQVTCPFGKLPKIIVFLQTSTVLNENTLALASYECEPPDGNQEKDRFKLLKSEQNVH